ncbi:MAG: GAF domain-containing protein [Deltaproteobacteria bacterium]|nr:GAF domain-containing protein [Deltaproteobacteria bacterium]
MLKVDYEELYRQISEIFNLQKGCVFMCEVDKHANLLEFTYPPKLIKNKVPIDNKTIVGRAVIAKRSYISNNVEKESNFAVLNCLMAMGAAPVQKMITYPILSGDKVRAVLQVARRGKTLSESPDFQKDDLGKIKSILDDLLSLHIVKSAWGE